MGAGSSTDKAIGRIGNLVADGTETVVKDQVSKMEDFYRHPVSMILPSIVGVICCIISVVVLFSTSACKTTKDGVHKCKGGNVKLAGITFVVGLLMVIVVQIVLAVRHPRATAETAAFNMFLKPR